MTALIDLNDVPQVTPQDLMRIMQRLIATENGLILLKGLNDNTRQSLEDAIWTLFDDQPESRLALMVRFECLIELFSNRRLRDKFTQHGLTLLGPAFAVAANQRLNKTWGFNPQKFLMGLLEKLALDPQRDAIPSAVSAPLSASQHEGPQLAA